MELEREIEKYLGREARAMGCLWYKFVSPGARGVPDRILILPDGKLIFIELKAESGELALLQVRQIERLRTWGQTVFVIRSMDGAQVFAAQLRAKFGKKRGGRK